MQNIRLTQLDGLRGLFSLMVILFHFPTENEFAGIHATSNFMVRQGDLFVDFFFVLSGFVISLNYENKINSYSSFSNYISQRFLRLYPLLFYSVIVFLAFELCFNVFLPQFVSNPDSVANLLLQTLNTLLFLNSTPVFGGMPGMNFPSWSISSEMISYIVFGLSLLIFSKQKKIALGFILLVSALFLITINSYMETYVWGFVRGLICFITGYYTFQAYKRYHTMALNAIWEYTVPIFLIIIFYLRFHHLDRNEIYTLFVIPPFFGIAVFIYALSNGYLVKLISGKVFQYLGKISYSMYLNHAIVMVIVTKAVFNVLKVPVTQITVSAILLLYIAAVIVYSHGTYIFIEKKGRTLLQSVYPFKKHIVPSPEVHHKA